MSPLLLAAHLASTTQLSTLGLGLGRRLVQKRSCRVSHGVMTPARTETHNDTRNAHQLQELPNFLIVLLGGSDLTPGKLIQSFVIGDVLFFLFLLSCLFSLSESTCKLCIRRL